MKKSDSGNTKYILYNLNLGCPLRVFDTNGNCNNVEVEYEEALRIRDRELQNGVQLKIMSIKEYINYCKKIISNTELMRKHDELCNDIREKLDRDLPKELKDQIKYDYEKKDRNINGFPSITKCDDNDDIKVNMWKRLEVYRDYIHNKIAFNDDDELLTGIDSTIINIKSAWEWYSKGKREKAVKCIDNIIRNVIDDVFFVSDLDKSYALRQVAPFEELRKAGKDYTLMMEHPLSLYRARVSDDKILKDRLEMVHRPYKSNEKIKRQRFTSAGIPALYLASTSYACWLELGKPQKDFYVSAFRPNEQGEKLKILNLVITQEMIDGFYQGSNDKWDVRRKELQNKMLIMWPLVMATSYKYIDFDENQDEYIIPELVMYSIKNFGIDGIAYISKNLEYDLQFQIGVNIVLPVYKEKLNNGYGKVCEYFEMTKPQDYFGILPDKYMNCQSGSFIYDIYYAGEGAHYRPKTNSDNGGKTYGEMEFARFDNYLTNMEYEKYLK